jgi:uncharacterized protein
LERNDGYNNARIDDLRLNIFLGDKRMGIHIDISKEQIIGFCRRNHIRSFAFFGSVLRDDFQPDSDIDVLVEFEQGQQHGLMELVDMQEDISLLLGRKVDLVERRAIEQSPNYIRRQHILKSLETVYVA